MTSRNAKLHRSIDETLIYMQEMKKKLGENHKMRAQQKKMSSNKRLQQNRDDHNQIPSRMLTRASSTVDTMQKVQQTRNSPAEPNGDSKIPSRMLTRASLKVKQKLTRASSKVCSTTEKVDQTQLPSATHNNDTKIHSRMQTRASSKVCTMQKVCTSDTRLAVVAVKKLSHMRTRGTCASFVK